MLMKSEVPRGGQASDRGWRRIKQMHPAHSRLFSIFDWCWLRDSPLRCSPLQGAGAE